MAPAVATPAPAAAERASAWANTEERVRAIVIYGSVARGEDRIASEKTLPKVDTLPHNSPTKGDNVVSVRQTSKHELAIQVGRRYAKANKATKTALLTEFVASTGYHRKYAIWLRRHGPPRQRRRVGRPARRIGTGSIGAG